MFRPKFVTRFLGGDAPAPKVSRPSFIESLEDRRLLSASIVHHAVEHAVHHATAKHASLKHTEKKATASTASSTSTNTTSGTSTTSSSATASSLPEMDGVIVTIPFSEAPTVVQSGLTALAATDKLAAPTSTQLVYLANSNGVETYTLDYTSSGTTTRLTVDQTGNPVTAPTQTTTTWAALDGSGTGSDAAAVAEILAIATALKLTAPTATTTVNVTTTASGAVTYTVRLAPASSTSSASTSDNGPGVPISVDSAGNPVGDQDIPFAAIPTGIQNGFNNHLPTGAAALSTTSTQIVNVRTLDGATTYSTTFTTSGTSTVVTINAAGDIATLPTETTTQFSDIPLAVQTELQTLATADGVTGTISSTQSVTAYDEGNGTVVYAVTLSATDSTTSSTFTITVASDQAGNPTVPPNEGRGGGCNEGEMDGIGANTDFGAVDFGMASFGGGGYH